MHYPNFSLLLLQNQQQEILLLRRINTPFCNNCYALPGGKIESGEQARTCLVREAKQSLGLEITPDDLDFVHVMHRKCNEPEFFAGLFRLKKLQSSVSNLQPERHDDMQWFSLETLPENMVPAHKHALEMVRTGVLYSEHGW